MFGIKTEDLILYEDRHILVCRKPAGLAVQSARVGVMDLESSLKNYLAGKMAPDDRDIPYLAVVHRLDQPVEGLLVFARTPADAAGLSRQAAGGTMEKYYLAATDRRPPDAQGELNDYLVRDGRSNASRVAEAGAPGAKRAVLSYALLGEIPDGRMEGGSRWILRIRLGTGRHHQIRVQMAHAGMPLIGDRKYNAGERSGLPLALCACRLVFLHPSAKRRMEFRIRPEGAAFAGFEDPAE